MKPLINYPVKVFAAGFIVLVLLSLPLFYIRKICEMSLLEGMPQEVRKVVISPSGLVPDEYEKDPNVVIHSQVSAYMFRDSSLSSGIFDYFRARLPGGRFSNVYFFGSDEDCKKCLTKGQRPRGYNSISGRKEFLKLQIKFSAGLSSLLWPATGFTGYRKNHVS